MNNIHNKVFQKLNVFVRNFTMLTILASGSAIAQPSPPPFSNKIMPDNKTYIYFVGDRLEYYAVRGSNLLVWDTQGYIGKDYNKFWFKAEGEALITEKEGEMEFQGLYSRAVSTYFDVQTGIRYDIAYYTNGRQSRGFAVIGLQGLAPYLFEIDGSLLLSESGDISAVFESELDLLFTQRLIGQPRFATNLALQKVEEFGIGSGFNNVRLGFRLRYEIKRELAPYIGISWNRKLAETAEFTRSKGNDISLVGFVAGLKAWF